MAKSRQALARHQIYKEISYGLICGGDDIGRITVFLSIDGKQQSCQNI